MEKAMTLVAIFPIYDRLFIISDIALTRDGDTNIPLPTRQNSQEINFNSGESVQGIAQKTIIIDDRIIIGWSGSQFAAKGILRDISDNASALASVQDILDFLESSEEVKFAQEKGYDVSLLGMIREANAVKSFRWDLNGAYKWLKADANEYYIIGSGAEHFLGVLRNVVGVEDQGVGHPDGDIMAQALMVLGNMIANNFISNKSLENHYGVAYEIAFYNGYKFVKFSDYNLVVSEIDEDASGNVVIATPHIMFKPFYYETVFGLFRQIYPLDKEIEYNSKVDNFVWIAPPVLDRVKIPEGALLGDDFQITSTFQITCYFKFIDDKLYKSHFVAVSYAPPAFICLEDDPKNVRFCASLSVGRHAAMLNRRIKKVGSAA